MKTIPGNVTQRLLFILHRGLTEVRDLAMQQGHEQIAALADALELLPKHVLHCNDQEWDLIHYCLQNYQSKYPANSFDHLSYLDKHDPPERY